MIYNITQADTELKDHALLPMEQEFDSACLLLDFCRLHNLIASHKEQVLLFNCCNMPSMDNRWGIQSILNLNDTSERINSNWITDKLANGLAKKKKIPKGENFCDSVYCSDFEYQKIMNLIFSKEQLQQIKKEFPSDFKNIVPESDINTIYQQQQCIEQEKSCISLSKDCLIIAHHIHETAQQLLQDYPTNPISNVTIKYKYGHRKQNNIIDSLSFSLESIELPIVFPLNHQTSIRMTNKLSSDISFLKKTNNYNQGVSFKDFDIYSYISIPNTKENWTLFFNELTSGIKEEIPWSQIHLKNSLQDQLSHKQSNNVKIKI